jgi:hypothetical protein
VFSCGGGSTVSIDLFLLQALLHRRSSVVIRVDRYSIVFAPGRLFPPLFFDEMHCDINNAAPCGKTHQARKQKGDYA